MTGLNPRLSATKIKGHLRRFPTWLLAAAVISVAMIAAFVVDGLQNSVLTREEARTLINTIEADVSEQHLAAHDALLEEQVTLKVASEVADERREIAETLDSLQALHLSDQTPARLREALDEAETDIDEELRLISAGEIEAANSFDEERTVPAFATLGDALDDASTRYEYTARRTKLLADVGTYLVALIAALVVLVIFRRYDRGRRTARRALEHSEERYKSLFLHSPDGVYSLDPKGRFVAANPMTTELTGYEIKDLLGKSSVRIIAPEDRRRAAEHFSRALRGKPQTYEMSVTRKDGRRIETLMTQVPIFVEGEVVGVYGIGKNITERELAEEALRRSEASLAAAQRMAHLGSWEYDPERDRMYWSDETYRIFGFAPQQFQPKLERFLQAIHPDDRESVREYAANTPRSGEADSIEHRILRPDGEVRYVQNQRKVERDEAGRLVIATGTLQDVTERKALEERLEHRAFHDSLTELPNRALFLDRLRHGLARTKRRGGMLAVLFMDLDNFKFVNDSLGHQTGDQLLVEVTKRLARCVRPGDTVSRFGGDEFLFLLEHIDGAEEARRVARRLASQMESPFVLDGREVFVTISIGIALGASGKNTPEDMLRDADFAVHEAKRKGKNRYQVFDASMEDAAHARLRLESDLRRAVDREEFRLRYQPVVPLESVASVGVEALLRWEHPERGLVSPTEFIPLAEETGLIVPIGRWVLREACRQAREWQDRCPAEPPLSVSVNLSARQFQGPDLTEDVSCALSDSGLPAESLILEVTESMMMESGERTAGKLEELKALGVKLSIDDFGTGYSSLSYLKRLPVDFLKIDRSFIDGLGDNVEDAKIVSTIIYLAKALDLEVVAEGVETERQLAHLRGLRCDRAQGYHFARPLASEVVPEFLSMRPVPSL